MPIEEEVIIEMHEPVKGQSPNKLLGEADICHQAKDMLKVNKPAYLEWQNINYFVPA